MWKYESVPSTINSAVVNSFPSFVSFCVLVVHLLYHGYFYCIPRTYFNFLLSGHEFLPKALQIFVINHSKFNNMHHSIYVRFYSSSIGKLFASAMHFCFLNVFTRAPSSFSFLGSLLNFSTYSKLMQNSNTQNAF